MGMIDHHIMRIAERRQNLITTGELERLGLTDEQRRRQVRTGKLTVLQRGVYSPQSDPFTVDQRLLALCLSIPEAVVSHASAAEFWQLRRSPRGRLEITVPHGRSAPRRGVLVHRSNKVPDHHVVELVTGLRVTSPARTVFDMGGVLDTQAHMSLMEDARDKRLCTDDELGEVYEDLSGRGRRGSAAWAELAHLLERNGRPTMSEYELRLQDALVAGGLPPAVQQHPVELPNGRMAYLDLAYLDQRIDIEVDHSWWHSGFAPVLNDKARTLGLAVLQWERLPFTEFDIDTALRMCVEIVRSVYSVRSSHHSIPAA